MEIAGAILRDHNEAYRSAHQDPVLERAVQLFHQLTLGRFTCLDLDQDGPQPVVLARRDTGDLLRTDQPATAPSTSSTWRYDWPTWNASPCGSSTR